MVAFTLKYQPDQDTGELRPHVPVAGKLLNLRVQRVSPRPVVELVQPGAEEEDYVPEKIAREQAGSPGLRTAESVIPNPSKTGPASLISR